MFFCRTTCGLTFWRIEWVSGISPSFVLIWLESESTFRAIAGQICEMDDKGLSTAEWKDWCSRVRSARNHPMSAKIHNGTSYRTKSEKGISSDLKTKSCFVFIMIRQRNPMHDGTKAEKSSRNPRFQLFDLGRWINRSNRLGKVKERKRNSSEDYCADLGSGLIIRRACFTIVQIRHILSSISDCSTLLSRTSWIQIVRVEAPNGRCLLLFWRFILSPLIIR